MIRFFPPGQLSVVLSFLLFASLACDATFIRDILARIDTTPTNCDDPAFVVTVLTDFNDGHCNTQCSLREAIQAANDCPGDDTVQLGAGRHTLEMAGSGADRGDLNITSNMTIAGVSPAATIIHPARSWHGHILNVAPGSTAHINGLTISGGDLSDGQGGGILNAGDLTLENAALQDNTALAGGGLYNTGSAHLTGVDVTNNYALADFSIVRGSYWLAYPDGGSSSDCGGGIANLGTLQLTGGSISGNSAYIGGGICNALGGTLTIDGTSISGNGSIRSLPALGGGIATFSNLTVNSASISDNMAQLGGGLYVLVPRAMGITLDDVTVQGNHASDDAGGSGTASARNGGGLYVKSGTLTIMHSRIVDNRSAGNGAGIDIEPGSGSTDGIHTALGPDYEAVHAIIRQSSIARNTAGAADAVGNGGGISFNGYYGPRGASDLELENVTISTNLAHNRGGAMYLKFMIGGARLTNVTIANNWAQITSGIDLDENSRLHLKNSLLALNLPWNCLVESGEIISEGYNMSDGNLCHLIASGDVQNISPGTTLQNTLTEVGNQWVHALLPGGSAVDWMDPARCPAADQRDMVRPQGRRCDVGAYELETVPLSLEITPLVFATETPTPGPITVTLVLTRNANCRHGPGAVYPVLTSVLQGQQVQLTGRNDDGSWLYGIIPGNFKCWIASSSGTPDGDPNGLPVLAAPPTPTPSVTPKPAQGATDFDQDGFTADKDCNDKNGKIHPGAGETPDDKVDSNCNGDDDT